jgi:hypothetical protein
MLTAANPHATGTTDGATIMSIVVHVQAVDCGAVNLGDTDNFCPVLGSNEMIGPFIFAGVKEGSYGLGFRVDASDEVVAATIAIEFGNACKFSGFGFVDGLGFVFFKQGFEPGLEFFGEFE